MIQSTHAIASSLLDKTGYTASSITDKTGYTVSTVGDKAGYTLTAGSYSVVTGVQRGRMDPTTGSNDQALTISLSTVTMAKTRVISLGHYDDNAGVGGQIGHTLELTSTTAITYRRFYALNVSGFMSWEVESRV